MDFHNRLANEAANYGGSGYGGSSYGDTPQVASASIGIGPQGGYQMGQISPVSLTLLVESQIKASPRNSWQRGR